MCRWFLVFPHHDGQDDIAGISGEFANTLVIEAGTDGASRVREAE